VTEKNNLSKCRWTMTNGSSSSQSISSNLVKDRLVTWLLQSGMDYLLISDFHPLSTLQTPSENSPFQIVHQHPYHAAHLVTASASGSVPCARIINACITIITRGQSNLTKSASWGDHSPVKGHPRGSKFVPLSSWGRVSY